MGIIIGLPYGIQVVTWMIVLAAIIHSLLMLRLSMKVMEADWGAFLKILIPGLQLMVVLGVKNWLVIQFFSQYITGALTILILIL